MKIDKSKTHTQWNLTGAIKNPEKIRREKWEVHTIFKRNSIQLVTYRILSTIVAQLM
jgi:hypothetical protein